MDLKRGIDIAGSRAVVVKDYSRSAQRKSKSFGRMVGRAGRHHSATTATRERKIGPPDVSRQAIAESAKLGGERGSRSKGGQVARPRRVEIFEGMQFDRGSLSP